MRRLQNNKFGGSTRVPCASTQARVQVTTTATSLLLRKVAMLQCSRRKEYIVHLETSSASLNTWNYVFASFHTFGILFAQFACIRCVKRQIFMVYIFFFVCSVFVRMASIDNAAAAGARTYTYISSGILCEFNLVHVVHASESEV